MQGYKHFHHRNIEPQFAFGHGLSYTIFKFSSLKLSAPPVSPSEFNLDVSLNISNMGSVAGAEVAQIYITLPLTSELTHPPLQLKGFAKVWLEPGQTQSVSVHLDKYSVSYWDDRYNTWAVEKGEYLVRVGPGSDKLPLQASFVVERGFEWQGI